MSFGADLSKSRGAVEHDIASWGASAANESEYYANETNSTGLNLTVESEAERLAKENEGNGSDATGGLEKIAGLEKLESWMVKFDEAAGAELALAAADFAEAEEVYLAAVAA